MKNKLPLRACGSLVLGGSWSGHGLRASMHVFGFLNVGANSTDDSCFYPDAPGLGRLLPLRAAPVGVTTGRSISDVGVTQSPRRWVFPRRAPRTRADLDSDGLA